MESNLSTEVRSGDQTGTSATISYSEFQIAAITISVIGITANVFVILLLTITKACKKGSTKWYILQLAIADTLFLIIVSLRVHFQATNSWTLQSCRAVWTIYYINYHSSVLFITVMAIDRYSAISHGFSVIGQKLRRRRSVIMITVTVWLISFVASLPAVIYSDVEYGCKLLYPESNNLRTGLNPACEIAKKSEVEYAYYWFEFVVMFLVPMLTTGTCYALIIKYSVLSRFRATGQYLDPKRKRAIITCVVLVVVFLICWTPHHARMLAFMKGIDATGEYCRNFAYVTIALVYVNSAANPFVYFIMIQVRQHFSTLMRACCCKDKDGANKGSAIPLSRLPRKSHEGSRSREIPPFGHQMGPSCQTPNTETSPMTCKTTVQSYQT